MSEVNKSDSYEFDNYIFKLNFDLDGNNLIIEKHKNNEIIFSGSFNEIDDVLLLNKKIHINLIDKNRPVVIKFSTFSNKLEVFKVYQKLERAFHEYKLRKNLDESYGKYKEEADDIYKKYIKVCDRFKKSMREAGGIYVKLKNENKELTNKLNTLLDQQQGENISNKPAKKSIKTSTGKNFNSAHYNDSLV
ncbi:hypothetical protein [Xenorhabdus innexi]|uniref:Uncharacterized protein n=1 Tax=Xenorhabdus innexi TaxID=290109 RepID=A0A1N6MSH9_9GAMM|nr:hypothetical protein [Xenorhabdus innexi]PHM36311.1 hypothetical protein Xinn_01664 [Xenorhabdus innexi]SIP71780.1 hypothetical protein XIS1_1260031 [Xenorhabdus innexi]